MEKLKVRFEPQEIAVEGDRGMIKKLGKTTLSAVGYRYVTALTNPQIRKLLAENLLAPELFNKEPTAVDYEGRRLILLCNPATRERHCRGWMSQYRRIEQRSAAGNLRLAQKPQAKVETLRNRRSWSFSSPLPAPKLSQKAGETTSPPTTPRASFSSELISNPTAKPCLRRKGRSIRYLHY